MQFPDQNNAESLIRAKPFGAARKHLSGFGVGEQND
jgi:hypothetical protein